MSRIVVKCEKCGEIGLCNNTDNLIDKVDNCNGNLIKVNITENEFDILCDISDDNDFLQAMIELKESDPIEYQLKMSQFKTQVQQQKSSKMQNDTTPRCPHCHSSNIQKIGGLERAGSVAMLGAFSKKINKSFKCKSCGYTW